MTYQERMLASPRIPEEIKKVVQSMDDVREAILRLEAVLEHGAESEGPLTAQEVKRLDKAVTVIKVGMKIAKKSLSLRDPKKHMLEE